MGDHFGDGFPADGERPVHAVGVAPSCIDRTGRGSEKPTRQICHVRESWLGSDRAFELT